MRYVQNLRNGRKDKHGCSLEVGWQTHCEGACGELVLAKHLGVYWSGSIGAMKADDVARFQVRTRSRHSYELNLFRDDPPDRAFVLVTGTAPRFRIRGWIYARDGQSDSYWSDPAKNGRPAFFVPHEALRPMVELPT